MDKNVRMAAIGLGHMGRAYVRAACETPGCSVAAACDLFAAARARFSAEFPSIPVYASVADLLRKAQFDAALVLTSDPCHAEPFIECLDAGKHVLVEKPVGNTIDEIRRMVAAIDRHPGLVTASGHILRYYAINRKIKQMADEGVFGEIFYMEGDYIHNLVAQADPERFNAALGKNWYLEDEKPMVGGGCHPFDVLKWVVNSRVVSVSSMGNRIAFPAMRHDDCIVSIYKFESGAVAKVTALYAPVAPRPPFYNIAVYGTKASVWRDQVCLDHASGWKKLEYDATKARFGHGLEWELADFANAIRTGQPVLAPARDCAESEVATLAATEALNENRFMPVPQL